MLDLLRRAARPLAWLIVLGLAVPAATADCRELPFAASSGMGCCLPHQDEGAGMKPDCCSVQTPGPAPERPAGTSPAARSPLAVAGVSDLPCANAPQATAWNAAELNVRPHPDRIYLLFSVIRR
jgi:hypothetical protein